MLAQIRGRILPYHTRLSLLTFSTCIRHFSGSKKNIRDFTSTVSPQLNLNKTKKTKAKTRRSLAKNQIEYSSRIDLENDFAGARDTTIICTIGPVTSSVEGLYGLLDSGMGIARLNMSHGDHKSHAETIKNLNTVRDNARSHRRIPIGLAIDLKGPEIRTGMVENGDSFQISAGDEVTLTTDHEFSEMCSQGIIYVDYEKLAQVVKVGNYVFMDDGLLSLKITAISDDLISIKTVAVNDATISHKKGLNIPGVSLDLPSVTEQDASDLRFAVEQDASMIFASFIRNVEDVEAVRACLGEDGKHIKIIAKIENHEGILNFDDILDVADGIMVARGDLGIEIPPEKVFLAQKMMISKANIIGKPVICATQMLESMTYNPRPTRAEVSDVANAVLDGADCVMLSGETSKGNYPNEAVAMMHEVCLAAQKVCDLKGLYRKVLDLQPQNLSEDENIAVSAAGASAENKDIGAIVITSISGKTARLIAKYRPTVPIVMVTSSQRSARIAWLYRGVYPYLSTKAWDPLEDYSDYVDGMIAETLESMQKDGLIDHGCKIVLVQNYTFGTGSTNTMRIIDYV